MRKYLFLDIDGVLNNTASRTGILCQFHHVLTYLDRPLKKTDVDIDEDNMRLIIQLIKEYDFEVVVTSMWRFGAQHEWFVELFALYGLDIALDRIHMLPLTDYECDENMRGEFIETFIKVHGCERYLCVDDTPEHYKLPYKNLVLTDMRTGFTEQHYQQCVHVMNSQ